LKQFPEEVGFQITRRHANGTLSEVVMERLPGNYTMGNTEYTEYACLEDLEEDVCHDSVDALDSWGDGWNGGTLSVVNEASASACTPLLNYTMPYGSQITEGFCLPCGCGGVSNGQCPLVIYNLTCGAGEVKARMVMSTPGIYQNEMGVYLQESTPSGLVDVWGVHPQTKYSRANHVYDQEQVCLTVGSSYILVGIDTYGDGWMGGTFDIRLTLGEESAPPCQVVRNFTVPASDAFISAELNSMALYNNIWNVSWSSTYTDANASFTVESVCPDDATVTSTGDCFLVVVGGEDSLLTNGETVTQVRYMLNQATGACASETQTHTCTEGTVTAWSGEFDQ
jgi:hypothetical protein